MPDTPDRGHLLTERRNEATRDIDALDTADLLKLMVEQDAAVIDAVRNATPALAALVDDVVGDVVAAVLALDEVGGEGAGQLGQIGVDDGGHKHQSSEKGKGEAVSALSQRNWYP